MSTQEKLNMLAEMLEIDVDDIDEDTVLSELEEWDSLNALNLIVLVDEEFGKTLTSDVVNGFKTVGDILAVMN